MFVLHRIQQDRLQAVESDIRGLRRFEAQLEIIRLIDNPKIRRAAQRQILNGLPLPNGSPP